MASGDIESITSRQREVLTDSFEHYGYRRREDGV